MLRWIFTDRQTDAKQCDNRTITMAPFGPTTHYLHYSSCTGRGRAAATTCHPAQPTRRCLSAGETTVRRSEQEKWERERLNHACSIRVLSHSMSVPASIGTHGNSLDSVCATAASRSESSAARLANARVIYFRKAVPVDSNSLSTRDLLWGYAFKN